MSKTVGLTELECTEDMTRDDIANELDCGFSFWTHNEMVVMVRVLDKRLEESEEFVTRCANSPVGQVMIENTELKAKLAAEIEGRKQDQLRVNAQIEGLLLPKAAAYDAMCDVGLIQYGEDPETRVYSVWGFTCWHHDEDILKAIAAADKPVHLVSHELHGGER